MKEGAIAAVLLLAATSAALLAFAPISVLAQKASQPGNEENFLPAGTGQPVTLKPRDLPDIQCSVVKWDSTAPKPTLTLLCPPEEVFSPLRVYIQLSWLKPEEVPDNVLHILASPKTHTKLRTSKKAAWVRLKVSANAEERPQEKWVSFTGLVNVALLTENVRIVVGSAPHP